LHRIFGKYVRKPKPKAQQQQRTIMLRSFIAPPSQENESPSNDCFHHPIFREKPLERKSVPSKSNEAEIELPDFEVIFERIRRVSPLARAVIDEQENATSSAVGLDGVDDDCECASQKNDVD